MTSDILKTLEDWEGDTRAYGYMDENSAVKLCRALRCAVEALEEAGASICSEYCYTYEHQAEHNKVRDALTSIARTLEGKDASR